MKRALLCLFASSVLCWNAQGQTILTLDQCLSMARERSPRLQSVRNVIRSAVLSHDELMTTALPHLSLIAAPLFSPATKQFGYDPAITDAGQISAQLSLSQSIYDGGIRSLQSDQIHSDIQRLEKEFQRAERDLAFSVKQEFYETFRTQERSRLLSESVLQLSSYLDIVSRLATAGTAAYTDVLKTEIQLSNATIDLEQSKDEYSVSKFSLAELIGATIDTSFAVIASWNEIDVATDSLPPLSEDHNLDLTIADMIVQRSQLDAEVIPREAFPVVSLTADAGYLTSGDNLKAIPPDRYRSVGFSLGIEIEFPLLNWGATSLRMQQRKLETENLRLGYELLRRSVTSEFGKLRLQILRLRERLQLLKNSRKKAEEHFLLTQSKYAGGETLSLEVLAAQQLLTEGNLAELDARVRLQTLLAQLEQLTRN